MQINKTDNAVRNIFFGIIQKTVNISMSFITRTVMIETLGANYLGLNSLFTSVLQVLNLAELGVGSAMIFSMYKPIAEDDKETICALMKLYRVYYRIIGLLILVAGLGITPFIPMLIKKDIPHGVNIYILYVMNLGSTVLSYWLFAYKKSILYAYQRNDVIDRTSAIVICVQQVIQVFVLFLFRNYYYYLMIVLGAQAAKNVMNAFVVSRMFPEYEAKGTLSAEKVKTINQRVKDLFTAKLGNTVVSAADAIVISSFMGLTALAVYNNYYYIMNAVITFVFMIFTACGAGIGNSLVTESLEKNYYNFKTLTFIISWISGFCVSCLYSLYQPFMKIWVGEGLMFTQSVVLLFCIYFYLYILCGVFSTYKDSAGIWHQDRFRPLAGAIVNLILNLAFVGKYGIYAILLSTIVSYLAVNIPWLIYNVFHVLFRRDAGEYIRTVLSYTVISLMVCVITACVCSLVKIEGIEGLLCKGFLCMVVPNILFLFIYRKYREFKNCLCIIGRIIRRKVLRRWM